MDNATMAIEPQIYDPDESLPRDLLVLRRFARIMDEAVKIPGTRRGVGVDALLGLFPGYGDLAGALLSTWIVFGAVRHRVPLRVILRMLGNILVDLVGGSIPLIGDFFDFFWEENVYNVDLLFKHRNRQRAPRGIREFSIVALIIVTLFASFLLFILGLMIWLAVVLLRSRVAM